MKKTPSLCTSAERAKVTTKSTLVSQISRWLRVLTQRLNLSSNQTTLPQSNLKMTSSGLLDAKVLDLESSPTTLEFLTCALSSSKTMKLTLSLTQVQATSRSPRLYTSPTSNSFTSKLASLSRRLLKMAASWLHVKTKCQTCTLCLTESG